MLKGNVPVSKIHVAHMGPTWDLSASGGPHVGPMNLAIRGNIQSNNCDMNDELSSSLDHLCNKTVLNGNIVDDKVS